MENKTPIEQWIEKESTEAFSDKYEQEIIKEAFNELLAYLGLSGIDNPREWVEKAKEQVPTDLASFLPKVVSETKNILNELKVINLTNEVTKLQSELKQAKAAKSEAWDKGFHEKPQLNIPVVTNHYFHELEQTEIDALIDDKKTIGYIMETYKQPDWCKYPNALKGQMGCWSLMDLSKDGLRTKISKDFCKGCDECSL